MTMFKKIEKNKFYKGLKLNLQTFAGDSGAGDGGSAGGTGDTGTGNPDAGSTNPDSWLDDIYKDLENPQDKGIPKERFDKLNDRYKSTKTSLDEATSKLAELTEKSGLTATQLRDLQTSTKAQSERITSLEGILTEMTDTRLSAIPEEMHDLIPTNLNVEQKLAWLIKAEEKGLFGGGQDDSEVPVGSRRNHADTKVNERGMSGIEKLLMGYSKK
jgi:cell division septum initiation protein DivIVA